jgi:acetyltransferase-like isoleucine patch superfamily enzyme
MKIASLAQTKQWLKTSDNRWAKVVFSGLKALFQVELPAPMFLLKLCYQLYVLLQSILNTLLRIFWWTPLFKGRLASVGKALMLQGSLPYIAGPLHLTLGSHCRISGQTSFTGRTGAAQCPLLQVGDNVDIGWMTTIAVGSKVSIGNNVRIAGRALLAGYPGHPMDPLKRAQGQAETEQQVGEIILEDDVWLATGVTVIAGVSIGRGTVVAAGSVVTKDLPAMVLAGGVPARVIGPIHND